MDWLIKNWREVGIGAVAVFVTTLIVFALLGPLGYPSFPSPGANPTVESANIAVGSVLIRWGLAVTLIAFVPAIVLSVIGAFRVEEVARTTTGGRAVTTIPAEKVLAAIPDVLKVPGGFGVLLILLGSLILAGTALGADGDPGATPTPVATASP